MQIDGIKYNKDLPKPSHKRKVRLISNDYEIDIFAKLSFLDSSYYDYYLECKYIEDKYILLRFRFSNNLGLIIKYEKYEVYQKHRKIINGRIYYQTVYYEFDRNCYYEPIKLYTQISRFKLNGLFELLTHIKYYDDAKQNSLINILSNYDKEKEYDFRKNFKFRKRKKAVGL